MTGQISIIFVILLLIIFMIWRRTRAMRRPINGNGIRMLVPVAVLLLLGTQLFGHGQYKGTTLETVGAIVIGVLFSIPLILTTHYEVREDGLIYAKQNKGFIFALVGLVIVRLALREYITFVDQGTLAILFYLLGVSYLTVWRVVSFIKFRKVYNEHQAGKSRGN
ncbi:MAG: CcdC family protein [Tumebacillaceae bacterium]